MKTDNMVFRSVSVDPEVDKALRAQADKAGVSKGEMYRRYLEKGMESVPEGQKLAALEKDATPLALRTVYLPFNVDETLRVQAFELRTSKSNLMRQFLRMGLEALQTSLVKTAAKKPARAPAKKAVVSSVAKRVKAAQSAVKAVAATGKTPAKTTTRPVPKPTKVVTQATVKKPVKAAKAGKAGKAGKASVAAHA